jgi:hypothetical protein
MDTTPVEWASDVIVLDSHELKTVLKLSLTYAPIGVIIAALIRVVLRVVILRSWYVLVVVVKWVVLAFFLHLAMLPKPTGQQFLGVMSSIADPSMLYGADDAVDAGLVLHAICRTIARCGLVEIGQAATSAMLEGPGPVVMYPVVLGEGQGDNNAQRVSNGKDEPVLTEVAQNDRGEEAEGAGMRCLQAEN